MGGEYLPDFEDSEVEIARVSMASTTGDVISVRAKWDKGAIHYAIVDEYDTRFSFGPKTSKEPLKMGEIVALMDSAKSNLNYPPRAKKYKGLVLPPLAYNYEGFDLYELERLRGFISVDSAFYPELGKWYDEVCEEWRDEKLLEDFLWSLEEQVEEIEGTGLENASDSFKLKILKVCRRYDLSPEDLVARFGDPQGEIWLASVEKKLSQAEAERS